MFSNEKTFELELRMLFLMFATITFVIAFSNAYELITLGYWIATILSAVAIMKLVRDMRIWAIQYTNLSRKTMSARK